MKIAVITGASSGMGALFAATADRWEAVDELWVMARRKERLEKLQTPFPARILAMDLTDPKSLDAYAALLQQEKPEVRLLVNAGGFGRFAATMDTPLAENRNMVELNCQALMSMCQLTVPYMTAGARIINIASVAAAQPVPYIKVYAATKAFVLSYSRGLNRELRSRGLGVTAVCPFWTKTEFFGRAVEDGKPPVVKKYVAMYRPEQIVDRAWRDARAGRDVSRFGFVARAQWDMVKLLPHRLVMDVWQRQQRLP